MNAIEEYRFPTTGQAVRTVTVDGEPWFIAADVTAILGYANGRDAVAKHVDPEDRDGVAIRDSIGREQTPTAVNESGLYSLIFGSKLETAKAFKRWVTAEVLPAIRKTGSYSLAPKLPASYAEALRELASTVEERDAVKAELAEAAPKADAWEVLASAKGDYSVREAANILNRDPAIDTGQNRLFQTLRDLKLIDRRDIPYARHSRHVVLRSTSWTDRNTGVERASDQVRVTADGLRYLRRLLGASPELPGLENLPDLARPI